MKREYSKEQLEIAISDAKSISDVVKNLGKNVNTGTRRTVKYWAKFYKLELPTWNPSDSTKRSDESFTISDEDWFQKNTNRLGQRSKQRLIKKGLSDKCVECGIGPEWNGKHITLQLDHIDGDKFNNLKDNLRILCPNCHSQTSTFGNSGRGSRSGVSKRQKYSYCVDCNREAYKNAARCSACEYARRVGKTKFVYPEIDELVLMIKKSSFSAVGRDLGCSDNAIRKHLSRNGVDWKKIQNQFVVSSILTIRS